ncbi:MAG: hypothetical protein ABJN34_03270 [Litoreibacter sp.]|uniref:hypothetical protein n=1 Tax=Litoreibacter sp. TaxID=1969459 RepID=UPI0032998E23
MPFDPTSTEHKAQLYTAIVAAAKLANEYFDDFLQIPFDQPWSLSPSSRRNLQRGAYSEIRAKVLYEFLLKQHFTVAHREAPKIFPYTPEMRWKKIVDEQAVEGQLKLLSIKQEMGIVQRASAMDAAQTTIKLGQEFCFELTSAIDCYALLLQGIRNTWHPVPLGQDGAMTAQIVVGANLLPQTSEGKPDPLVESHDLGLHEFVMVTTQTPDIPMALDKLVSWVHEADADLFKAKVRVLE